MDHLTHIEKENMPPLYVPFLGNNGMRYDGLGFSKFHDRCGVNLEAIAQKSYLEFNLDEIASYLQAHLFFGFLHEFFGMTEVKWREREFICDDLVGGSRITTCFLPTLIWFWVSDEVHRDPAERGRRFEKYSSLFEMVEALVSSFTTKDRTKYQEAGLCGGRGSLVLLSVIILLETLGQAFRTTFVSFHESKIIQPIPPLYSLDRFSMDIPSVLTARLKSAGWCAGEIESLEHEALLCSSMYVLGSVDRSRLQRVHDKCTKEVCKADQVDKTTYKTKHCDEKCSCSFFPEPGDGTMERVLQILDSGNIPIISISEPKGKEKGDDGGLDIEVSSYDLVRVSDL